MAASVYSTRFIAWASEEEPPAYTVPAGSVAVVRDLDVVSGGGAIINWKLSVNDLAQFAAGQFTVESIPQATPWRGRQVVYPGEIIVFQSDGPTDGMVSGYLLTFAG